jgi:hypothetical protein
MLQTLDMTNMCFQQKQSLKIALSEVSSNENLKSLHSFYIL